MVLSIHNLRIVMTLMMQDTVNHDKCMSLRVLCGQNDESLHCNLMMQMNMANTIGMLISPRLDIEFHHQLVAHDTQDTDSLLSDNNGRIRYVLHYIGICDLPLVNNIPIPPRLRFLQDPTDRETYRTFNKCEKLLPHPSTRFFNIPNNTNFTTRRRDCGRHELMPHPFPIKNFLSHISSLITLV